MQENNKNNIQKQASLHHIHSRKPHNISVMDNLDKLHQQKLNYMYQEWYQLYFQE